MLRRFEYPRLEILSSQAVTDELNTVNQQNRNVVAIFSAKLRVALNIYLAQIVMIGAARAGDLGFHLVTKMATRLAVKDHGGAL
jgi:hypothetical protein